MQRQKQRQTTTYTVFGLAGLLLIFSLYQFGFFKPYAYLFSENHLHRPNFLFRLGFIGLFALLNYGLSVPRFYLKKHYSHYLLLLIAGLVGMLVLPDFLIEQPQFDPSLFKDKERVALRPKLPIPLPLFEMTNAIVLFLVTNWVGLVLKTRQKEPSQTIERAFSKEETAVVPQIDPSVKKAIEAVEMPKIEEKTTNSLKESPKSIEKTTELAEATADSTTNSKETSLDAVEKTTDTALIVTINYSLVRLEFAEILYIKSMDNYLQFYLKDKKPILVRMTLKEALERLPTEGFLRVHKSYIVAVSAINSIRNKTILVNNQDIPIGRAYEQAVFKIFGK